jgi:hypothetical protein
VPPHRGHLLLSPEEYFDLADTALRSCRYRSSDFDGPFFDKYRGFYEFKGIIRFHGGYVLKFFDSCFLKTRSSLTRDISYDFRLDGEKLEDFRFDNHGKLLELYEPCHLHLNGAPELYEDDPRLKGYSLVDMHLLEMLKLIHKRMDGGRLPWE